jgi:hypothetical protein
MERYEVRQLVENYYDIQKIRVETFNRIVMFVKENESKFKEILSHGMNETQQAVASQFKNETHLVNASQINDETQNGNASHGTLENQGKFALKLLEEKKYSEFVKKYVLSQRRYETQVKSASHEISETRQASASQEGCETHILVAFSPFIKQIENLIWFHNKLYETEKELYKRLDAWSRNHPLRKKFLNRVRGIGPVLSSGIIAWYSEAILKAPNVSKIWKYSGLAPGQESHERRRGEKLDYNPRLKTFAWKIGESFIKFKCFGRKLYDSFKEQAKQKHPDWTKLHIHNYAKKKVVKIFIASVWEVWRKMNNLPTTKPYPIEFLGHRDIITPEMWMEKGGEDEDE